MLKPLRLRLALAYTLMAGVLLTLVSLFCLQIAERQLNQMAQTAFQSGTNAIVYKLQSERMLSQAWLSQSETGSRQIIHIEDDGVPLAFQGAWTPLSDRESLIASALAQADHLGLHQPLGTLEPTGITFPMQGDAGERYYASVTLIPSTEHMLRVAIIKDMLVEDTRIEQQRTTVLLLILGGLLLIMVSGWFYSGRAVKPAEESNRQQVEFIALASHELKAPLSVIRASADALTVSGQDALLKNIRDESTRMARLVDDLLLLSRTGASQWSLKKQPVDADTLLIECYESFCPVAHEKGISLGIDLPDMPFSELRGDAERLKQVLSILLDNALTYTPERGHVQLRARAEGRHLRISVSDDGPGIPRAEKERVFDRFYRAQSSHTDRNHAGLGLSIARELVHLHGGRIWVEDAAPHGARFLLDLPFAHVGKMQYPSQT